MSIRRALSWGKLSGPLAAVLAACVVIAAQSAAAQQPATSSTIGFRTVTLSDAFSPGFGPPGTVAVSRIENRQGTHVIGRDQTACVVIKLPDMQCSSTIGLPGGTVQISFHQSLSQRTILAPVAGGTGRFADAQGYLALREIGSGQTVFAAVLHLGH